MQQSNGPHCLAVERRLRQHLDAGIIDTVLPDPTGAATWLVGVRGATINLAGLIDAEVFLAACDAVARGESHPQMTSPWVWADGTIAPGMKVRRACFQAFGDRLIRVCVESTTEHITGLFGEPDRFSGFWWTIALEKPDRTFDVVGILVRDYHAQRPHFQVISASQAAWAARAVAGMIDVDRYRYTATPAARPAGPARRRTAGWLPAAARWIRRYMTN